MRILSSWLSIVLLNGVATAVYNLTGLENLYLYTALATTGITYVLVKNLVVSVQRQKRQMSVVLYNKTVSVPCIGLLDSGNLLTMPLSGNPVHIADAALLQKLVDEKTVQKGDSIPCTRKSAWKIAGVLHGWDESGDGAGKIL